MIVYTSKAMAHNCHQAVGFACITIERHTAETRRIREKYNDPSVVFPVVWQDGDDPQELLRLQNNGIPYCQAAAQRAMKHHLSQEAT